MQLPIADIAKLSRPWTNRLWQLVLVGNVTLALAVDGQTLDQFVIIKGNATPTGNASVKKGRSPALVEDFEMLDHPVSNREYELFVKATRHARPLHWQRQ